MDITLTEWFLIGTNLCTLVILSGLLRDARRLNHMCIFTMKEVAEGRAVLKARGNSFYIVPKGEDDGIQK